MSNKLVRFGWRALRNALCVLPGGTSVVCPSSALAAAFGRGDANYAWNVFAHHRAQMREAGVGGSSRALEVGPGRNLGTALLFWAAARGAGRDLRVVCWDVFPNAKPDEPRFWQGLASELVAAAPSPAEEDEALRAAIAEVAEGRISPTIDYRVEPLENLVREFSSVGAKFDLVYSHAAIEHVWRIEPFWDAISRVTAAEGWHSHRIDLADHGSRDSNYIEMLEWSPLTYWLTMRFIPGAINRWRASDHLRKLGELGYHTLVERRTLEPILPIPRKRLASQFRDASDEDLRAIALDVVARYRRD